MKHDHAGRLCQIPEVVHGFEHGVPVAKHHARIDAELMVESAEAVEGGLILDDEQRRANRDRRAREGENQRHVPAAQQIKCESAFVEELTMLEVIEALL